MGTAYYYVDSTTCLANAQAISALCQTLNSKGLISDLELEAIRHEQLQRIDDVLVDRELPRVIAELLEHRRDEIEQFWGCCADDESRRSPLA